MNPDSHEGIRLCIIITTFLFLTGVGCHALPPRDLPDLGIEPTSLRYSTLAGRFFTTSATWEAPRLCIIKITFFLNKAAGVIQLLLIFFLHPPASSTFYFVLGYSWLAML